MAVMAIPVEVSLLSTSHYALIEAICEDCQVAAGMTSHPYSRKPHNNETCQMNDTVLHPSASCSNCATVFIGC